jgi:hypothetical protein
MYTNGQTAGTATFPNGIAAKGQYFAGFLPITDIRKLHREKIST